MYTLIYYKLVYYTLVYLYTNILYTQHLTGIIYSIYNIIYT